MINALPLVTYVGTVHMTQGPIELIVNQYAYHGKGSTVHLVRELSHLGLGIDDQSSVIPGHKQQMVTPDQWIIPYNILNGLTRMPIQSSMDDDLDKLPHVVITNDNIWDPTVLNHLIDIENDIYHPTMDSNIDEEDFTPSDECTSMTRSYMLKKLKFSFYHDLHSPEIYNSLGSF